MGESSADKALATQIANIEKQTGKTIAELGAAARAAGCARHGEMRDFLKKTFALGHGNANVIAQLALKSDGDAPAGDPLDAIYAGAKAGLRPVHERLMLAIEGFGPFETAPKKGYVSLRRKKQFAMLGPKTKDRFELGLNLKEDAGDPRAVRQAPGGMCQYVVALKRAEELDDALIALVRRAYDAAG